MRCLTIPGQFPITRIFFLRSPSRATSRRGDLASSVCVEHRMVRDGGDRSAAGVCSSAQMAVVAWSQILMTVELRVASHNPLHTFSGGWRLRTYRVHAPSARKGD